MTAVAKRGPVCPDLEQLMHDLRPVAVNLRQLEEKIVWYNANEQYRFIGHQMRLLSDAEGVFRTAAARMAMRWGALLLFVEQAADLKKIMGRRPTLAQVQRAVEAAQRVKSRDRSTRDAQLAIASYRAMKAAEAVDDAEDLTRYMDASCG